MSATVVTRSRALTAPFDIGQPGAVGVALTSLARLPVGASHRQAGDRRGTPEPYVSAADPLLGHYEMRRRLHAIRPWLTYVRARRCCPSEPLRQVIRDASISLTFPPAPAEASRQRGRISGGWRFKKPPPSDQRRSHNFHRVVTLQTSHSWNEAIRGPTWEHLCAEDCASARQLVWFFEGFWRRRPDLNRGWRFCRFNGGVNRVVSCWSLVGPAAPFCLLFGP
jgi:hypothetical protein